MPNIRDAAIAVIPHDNQPCDCGAIARYRVPVRLGSANGHFYLDSLDLCDACYQEYLEIEQRVEVLWISPNAVRQPTLFTSIDMETYS